MKIYFFKNKTYKLMYSIQGNHSPLAKRYYIFTPLLNKSQAIVYNLTRYREGEYHYLHERAIPSYRRPR